MTTPVPIFLVIDHNHDSRFLLVKSLQRKFPTAFIMEADNGETALQLATSDELTAIITHRTLEYGGAELVQKLRSANRAVPIVMVSGIEQRASALAAGANLFLLYDQWLLLGTLVKELIEQGTPAVPLAFDPLRADTPRPPETRGA